MPSYTENLNLEKPLESENYDVGVFNGNADKIDAAFGEPITASKIADNAIITSKLADDAVTSEKLADVYTKAEHPDVPVDLNTLTTPGFYAVPATRGNPDRYTNGPDRPYADFVNYDISLSVWVVPGGYGTYDGSNDVYYNGLMQVAISIPYKKVWIRRQTVPYDQPEAEPSWSEWEELGGVPDGSITADKLAEESVNFEKLSADMLARAKSFITEISGDGQPQAIPLPLGSGFSADKTYKLSIEARLVSGSGTVDLGPNMPTDSAGYYHWDSTGDYLTLTSDWQTAWVDNVQGITSAGLQLYGSASPVTVQLRNIHLTDADGNDVIDQQALREVGTCIPSPDDSPDTRPENKVLPTLAYVQEMLAELEARIAALEGGGA